MKKRRRPFYRRRPRTVEEVGGDGQDSFLDVVSNLVGVLIILVMVAGTRARNVAADAANDKTAVASASENAANDAYAAAVKTLDEARQNVVRLQNETEDLNARTLDRLFDCLLQKGIVSRYFKNRRRNRTRLAPTLRRG